MNRLLGKRLDEIRFRAQRSPEFSLTARGRLWVVRVVGFLLTWAGSLDLFGGTWGRARVFGRLRGQGSIPRLVRATRGCIQVLDRRAPAHMRTTSRRLRYLAHAIFAAQALHCYSRTLRPSGFLRGEHQLPPADDEVPVIDSEASCLFLCVFHFYADRLPD